MDKIYILFGEYDDKSGVKIPRAYKDKESAHSDLNLLEEWESNGSLKWEIIEVPIHGSTPNKPILR